MHGLLQEHTLQELVADLLYDLPSTCYICATDNSCQPKILISRQRLRGELGECKQARSATDLDDELLVLILSRYHGIRDIYCKAAISARVAADVDLMANTHLVSNLVHSQLHQPQPKPITVTMTKIGSLQVCQSLLVPVTQLVIKSTLG